jgi:ribonuclease I
MNYFSKSLVLFEAVNVGRLLEDFNIKPGTKTTKEAVKKALSKPFGTQVSVHCVPEGLYLESEPVKSIQKNHDLRNQVLESVHFCYSHDTIEPMDCPDSDQCPSSFMYPSQLSK